jgi:hypothetical protein
MHFLNSMSEAPPIDINQVLQVNELNLQKEMSTCPAWYYYYAALAIDAEEGADNATLAVETYEQLLASDYKSKPSIYGDMTVTDIKRHFRGDAKWQLLKEQENKLRTNAKLLDKAAKALEMKSRMLMSINKRDMYKKGVFDKGDD